ncbi:BTAD domain-containing putative transcriptional regulator [Streptomyces sp. NPDC001817]|uniref:BTAD domain-containing putative transcriptional regulator n=1 Tax=Streptomyces sp. NPDC001817 TaxID=3154398 RepID=UPI00331F78A2
MDGDTRLRVTLLRAVQALRGDTVVPVAGARLQGLLVRLALAGGRAVEPGVLVDAIWAVAPPTDPAHALQALVSRLRRTLGPSGAVAAVAQAPGGYRLAVDEADVDALRFEQLTAVGRERLRAGDPRAAASVLGEAVALWGDSPGAEPTVVAAVAPAAATRLAHAWVEAVADLAEAELLSGRAEAAADRVTALLAEQPVYERAAALLMDALAAQGRQAEALARYEQVRAALADSLGVDPGTALRERHVRLLRAEQPTPAALAGDAAQTRPSNLPVPLTRLIGRDEELDRIEALLAAGRLVTVLGPGGAGKTRLAIEAAHRHRHQYRDGTWLVDLAPVTEPAKVGAALLAATGLRGSALFEASAPPPGGPVGELDALADQLGGRESLLVVDNCEHLIDAVAHLVPALLARCAGLRVLATSREPFAVGGEALVPLGPLALPEPNADVEQARGTESVRLFTERAAAVRPGFDVDARSLGEVLRVVRCLDGMPLALELAAARLRTLSLADLAAGLSDRFRLLATGSRAALPRHRSLRAVIAWSWDLLDADTRTVAERISVLPGGVTPASAVAVCAGTSVPVDEIPELLAGLVDRSLLQFAPDTGRYRMLETIREYGLARLAEHGTLTGARDLVARWFADLAAHHDPLLRGPEQLDALKVLRAEYDNVLAALRHLCDTGDAPRANRLGVNLAWYWQMLGRHLDAIHWLRQTTALPTQQPGVDHDIAHGTLLLHTVAAGSTPVKDLIDARREKLLALTQRLVSRPYPEALGAAPTAVALAYLLEETSLWSTAVQRLVDGPDVWSAGLARMFRARFSENEGHLAQVRSDVTAALECFARAGDRWGQAKALPLRALLRQYDGDLDGALADLTEATRLAGDFGPLGFQDEIFLDLRWIDLYARRGETVRAAETIAAARECTRRSVQPRLAILLAAREAALCMQIGDLDRARELLESPRNLLSGQIPTGDYHLRALVETARGALCLELADRPGAEQALRTAYAAAIDSTDMPLLATVTTTVAALAALDGQYRDAAVLLGAAARLRGAHDPADPQIRTLSSRGRAALGDEAFTEAYETGWRLDAPAALTRADPVRLSRTPPPATHSGPSGVRPRGWRDAIAEDGRRPDN